MGGCLCVCGGVVCGGSVNIFYPISKWVRLGLSLWLYIHVMHSDQTQPDPLFHLLGQTSIRVWTCIGSKRGSIPEKM